MHKFTLLPLLLSLVTSARLATAQGEPIDREKLICRAVVALCEREHMSPAPMPADFDEAVLELYLRRLDPRKMYFQQADVDALGEHAKGLQQQLRRGDLSFMESVLKVYRRRVREYDEIAREFADAKFDFDLDESINLDFRSRSYCVSVVESRQRWRKWTKYELLACRLPGETITQKRARLKQRYSRFFNQVVTAQRESELEEFLTVVTSVFDHHSSYLSSKTIENFSRW